MIGMSIHNPTPEQCEMMKALASALGRLSSDDRRAVLSSIEETVRLKDAAIERLTAENERLRALITSIADRHSRIGDLEYDDVIVAAVSGCQQKEKWSDHFGPQIGDPDFETE